MILSKEDIHRLSFLLGKHRHDVLSNEEKTELTDLIFKEVQYSDFILITFNKMIELGLIIVGTYTVFEEFKKTLGLDNGKKEIR